MSLSESAVAVLASFVIAQPAVSAAQVAAPGNVVVRAFADTCGAADGDRAEAAQNALAGGWREVSVADTFGAAVAANITHLYRKDDSSAILFLAVGNLPNPDRPGTLFEACNVYAYPSSARVEISDPRPELASWLGVKADSSISTSDEPHFVFTVSNGVRTPMSAAEREGDLNEMSQSGLHAVSAIHGPQKSMISYLVSRFPG